MSTLRTDAIVDLAGNGKPDLTNGLQIGGVAVTSTAAEINILDGVTSTTAELNILDGVTSTAAELNILDGVTSTAAELNILDGVTSTAAELNILDGVTSTAAELNIMDGVTATAAEINLIDGGTARGTTALADGDGILINDAGTMRMSTVQTVKTYMVDGVGASTSFNAVGTYALVGIFSTSSSAVAPGTTSAGSSLFTWGLNLGGTHNMAGSDTTSEEAFVSGQPLASSGGVTLSGTWRFMNSNNANAANRSRMFLAVRIS